MRHVLPLSSNLPLKEVYGLLKYTITIFQTLAFFCFQCYKQFFVVTYVAPKKLERLSLICLFWFVCKDRSLPLE